MTEETTGPSAALSPLARARLDDLLGEVLTRVGDVLDTQDRLRGLLDAVVGINADLSLERALERIIKAAVDLVGARYGALGVLEVGPGRRLREFVTAGLTDEERAAIGELPRGHGILGVIIDRPEPLRLPVLGDDPSSYGFPPNHPPMETFLGVPIRTRDRVFGNLYLTEKRGGGTFTAEDEGVVVALAAAAGVVIENARLFEETARRQRWLEAAAEVSSALLTETGREDKLRRVAELAREVPGADTAVGPAGRRGRPAAGRGRGRAGRGRPARHGAGDRGLTAGGRARRRRLRRAAGGRTPTPACRTSWPGRTARCSSSRCGRR